MKSTSITVDVMTDDVDVSREDLTDKQLELLEMIRENPDASQKEFADELGITPTAIGSRVRQIPGMNWMSQRWFIQQFFDGQDSEEEIDDQVDSASQEKLNDHR